MRTVADTLSNDHKTEYFKSYSDSEYNNSSFISIIAVKNFKKNRDSPIFKALWKYRVQKINVVVIFLLLWVEFLTTIRPPMKP